MPGTLSLQEFYNNHFCSDIAKQFTLSPQLGHFNVFPRGIFCKRVTAFTRSDFYKISLVIGAGKLHFSDRTIEIDGKALIFYNPDVACSWESISEKQDGYCCLFNTNFLGTSLSDSHFIHSPLVKANQDPVIILNQDQADELSIVFKKMMKEVESTYTEKYDILRHYIHILIHEAHKMQPDKSTTDKPINASIRISSLFIEMLERQFPVDSIEHALKLKSPHDFANKLSIHVNHLNRTVKDITGKSTSDIISTRIANEAKSLLKNTDYNVAEIAYSLGFEHPSNFNTFFKKQTGLTPKLARQ